jgi:ABC-2 type transport system ATP-binding protein
MLKLENITKVFKSDLLRQPFVALDNVSYEINTGEIIGFLGANGAGKTTSLKIIMDFIRPTSGKVIFDLEMGKNKQEIFKNIGFLPERPYFYPHITGREFCQFMGKLTDLDLNQINSQVAKWAHRFKIDFALDRPIRTYSKGMLQRIGFLVTILHDPKLIILDEPLSGVDPIGRKELKDIIVEIHKSGKTIFFSSHIVSDVEEICDSVVFLKEGKLIYNGSVDKIITENIKLNTTIRYSQNNKVEQLIVKEEEKNNKIKSVLDLGGNILSIEPEKPTLEEIFYQIKD